MTRESKNEVVIAALIVSVLLHLGLMFFVRSRVMTQVAASGASPRARAPMRVTKRAPLPEPMKTEAVEDLSAQKDEPRVESAPAPEGLLAAAPEALPNAVSPAALAPVALPSLAAEAPVFEVRPISAANGPSLRIPVRKVETPSAAALSSSFSSPEWLNASPAPALPALPAACAPSATDLPTRFIRETPNAVSRASNFVPATEVYEKVDEAVVELEKAAVRDLIESPAPQELPKFVQATMVKAEEGAWTYFKAIVLPRSSLSVVSKDLVILLDASGSIGFDRLGSVRKAAKRILRSALNTGDRFNLVAFRDRFSYAFRAWQNCSHDSFAAADDWLNNLVAHGRTDVFSTISSVLTLPRDPKRPMIALVVTDGDANSGVSETPEILSRFTKLNEGLVSVYMYGVKSSANRELIDLLTRGNAGESFIFDGWRWSAGEGIEGLSERFRDPVLSDLRVIFTADTKAEAYPTVLRNLYRGASLEIVGRVPANVKKVAFSLRGLNGGDALEGFFSFDFTATPRDPAIIADWKDAAAVHRKLH